MNLLGWTLEKKVWIIGYALIVGMLLVPAAWGADQNGSETAHQQETVEARPVIEGDGYRISPLRKYHIDGVTQKYILDNYLDFDEKRLFKTIAEIDEYITEKEQEIINQRIFDSGRIVYEIRKNPEGPDWIIMDIYVDDTWNIVVLPYGKYDSNDGLLLSLRGRHYNFLGSMQTLEANLDYWYTDDGEHEVSLNSDLGIPFKLWNHEWVFGISEDAVFTPDEPLEFNLGTDLGVYLPFWDVRWKLTYSQDFHLNDDGEDDEDGYYLKSGLKFGGGIPTGWYIDGHEVKYSPSISTSIAYKLEEQISEDRRGPDSSFKQSLKFGRVDWIENFRRGYKVSLSNSNSYNFYDDDWDYSINSEIEGHLAGNWIGLDSRLKGFYLIDDQDDDAGGPLRGILDDRIDDVEAGAYLNLDMPFPMWIWFMSRWFTAQLSPFFDIAYFEYGGTEEDWDPLWYSGGIEGFAYLRRSRSIYLRVSLGIDLQAMFEGGGLTDPADRDGDPRYELYIGLGHHY